MNTNINRIVRAGDPEIPPDHPHEEPAPNAPTETPPAPGEVPDRPVEVPPAPPPEIPTGTPNEV